MPTDHKLILMHILPLKWCSSFFLAKGCPEPAGKKWSVVFPLLIIHQLTKVVDFADLEGKNQEAKIQSNLNKVIVKQCLQQELTHPQGRIQIPWLLSFKHLHSAFSRTSSVYINRADIGHDSCMRAIDPFLSIQVALRDRGGIGFCSFHLLCVT